MHDSGLSGNACESSFVAPMWVGEPLVIQTEKMQ